KRRGRSPDLHVPWDTRSTVPALRPVPFSKKNPAAGGCGVLGKNPGDDLLSHARCTLPSARARFTSEFGMESGGSTQLLSPGRGWRVAVQSRRNNPRDRSRSRSRRVGCSEADSNPPTHRRVQGHLRLYGQATRIISTG